MVGSKWGLWSECGVLDPSSTTLRPPPFLRNCYAWVILKSMPTFDYNRTSDKLAVEAFDMHR